MEPKKVTGKTLEKVLEDLKSGSVESAIGNYLFKDYRIQISQYRASGAERAARLYRRRRNSGQCVVCGEKVIKKNPSTGKLYRLCENHRQEIDRKTAQAAAR